MRKTVFLFSILALCLVQSVFAQENVVASYNARGYLLGPGDEIRVKVLGEADFNFEAAIDDNGSLEIPLADAPISAMCKNERELRAEVTKVYSKYLRTPQVSLQILKRNSRPPVTMGGEIKTPGTVILTRQTRLLELISFSGGITEDAGGLVQVIRPQAPLCGTEEEMAQYKAESANVMGVPSRLYSLSTVSLGTAESNPVIYPGDLIFVQKAKPVYFTGEIVRAGNLIIPEGGLRLTQAIAMQGGVSPTAKTKEVKIYRLKPDSTDRYIIPVNYEAIKTLKEKDVNLEPYDIVEVDKSKDSVGKIIMKALTGGVTGGITSIGTGGISRILY